MTWLDDHIFESKQKGTRCGYRPGCTAIVHGDETICIDCIDAYEEDREHDTYYDPLRPTPMADDDSEEEDDDMCDECGVYQHEMKEPWNQNGLCPACEREEDEKEKAKT